MIRKYWTVSGRLRSVEKPIRPILVLSFGFHSTPAVPDHTLPTFMRVYWRMALLAQTPLVLLEPVLLVM